MKKSMRDCILEQPQTIVNVIENIDAEIRKTISVTGTGWKKVFLVGSGSSLNAAYGVKSVFEKYARANVQIITPSDFLYYYPDDLIDSETLVIGISQTARSIGTIDSVEKAKKNGAMTVFVTAEPENQGARSAHVVFNTCTGEELVGAKTKGYTSTMASMMALAAAYGGKVLDLSRVPEDIEFAISQTSEKMPLLIEEFSKANAMTVVGYGPCISDVMEGGLKLLETVRIPTERYDVEEYMHGPYHCLENTSYLIFLAPEGAGQERMARLVQFCEQITPHTLVIGNRSFVNQYSHNLNISMPDGIPEMLAPLSFIVPMQLMANDVTHFLGRKPEASRYPNFHKMLGSKFMPPINYYTGE